MTHETLLAPTEQALRSYQHGALSWEQYAVECVRFLEARRVEEALGRAELTDAVVLCSEASPDRCHRRLAADHLASAWGDTEIVHLV